jgi:hypothetical protein
MKRRLPSRQAANVASDVARPIGSRQTEQKVPDRFPLVLLCRPATLTRSPFSPSAIGRQHYARLFSFFIKFGIWTTTRVRRLVTPSSTRSLPPQADPRTALARARGWGSPHSRVATDSTGTHRNVTHSWARDFTSIVRDSTGTPDSAMFRTVRHLAHLSRGFYRQTLIRSFK